MAASDRQLFDALSRMPFVDSAELAPILGEPHATVHRALVALMADGIVGRVNHGTVDLPSSGRFWLTARGIGEAVGILGFGTPSDFVRAYPVSREWLTLLIGRMDAVAAVYRLASSMSPGTGGRRSYVEFHRRGRFDATITLHDSRSFGVVRQGLALRRRSLYDRLRAIAEYDYTRRPDIVLILVPSVWEQRLTTRFCEERDLRDCFVAVESREALERRGGRVWQSTSFLIGGRRRTLEGLLLLTVAEDIGGPFGECFLPSLNMVVVGCIPGGQMVHRLLALHRLQHHRGPKNRSVVPTSLRHFLLIHEGNSCPQVWSRILTCLPVQFSKSTSA